MVALASADPVSRYGDPPPPARRAATLAAVVAVHFALALLLLARRDPFFVPPARVALNAFDIVLPPPSPRVVPPRQPPAQVTRPRVAPAPGGSSGRVARSSAPGAAGAAAAMDATLVREAPPAPPPRTGIGTAADLTGPAAAGMAGAAGGFGDGRGTGTGDGTGSGSGSGGGITWRRAEWIEKPDGAAVARVYPAATRRERRSGSVLLACIVPRPGRPRSCKLVSEEPRRWAFGAAAMQLWRDFHIRPVNSTLRDHPELPVLVPIEFVYRPSAKELAAAAAAAATPAAGAPPAPPQP